jgi:membrane associated rhomboid family serine protease
MIPYRDDNETLRTPVVTIGVIGLTVAVWLSVQGAGAAVPLATSVCNLGLIAAELTASRPPGAAFPMGNGLVCLTDPGREPSHLLTSMFLHGSWMHLIGNMWFLWLFGDNVEDAMTRPRFVLFYLVCGMAAAGLQVAMEPSSIVPMVGASGAISGVMGAYLVLYPHVRVRTLVPFGFILTTVGLPAWGMLLYWAFIQFVGGLGQITGAQGGGVAFWAHVGGFVTGMVLAKAFVDRERFRQRSQSWQPRRLL